MEGNGDAFKPVLPLGTGTGVCPLGQPGLELHEGALLLSDVLWKPTCAPCLSHSSRGSQCWGTLGALLWSKALVTLRPKDFCQKAFFSASLQLAIVLSSYSGCKTGSAQVHNLIQTDFNIKSKAGTESHARLFGQPSERSIIYHLFLWAEICLFFLLWSVYSLRWTLGERERGKGGPGVGPGRARVGAPQSPSQPLEEAPCVLPPPPFPLSAPPNTSHTRTTTTTVCVCVRNTLRTALKIAPPNTHYPSPSTISRDHIPVPFDASPYYSQCSQLF